MTISQLLIDLRCSYKVYKGYCPIGASHLTASTTALKLKRLPPKSRKIFSGTQLNLENVSNPASLSFIFASLQKLHRKTVELGEEGKHRVVDNNNYWVPTGLEQ